MEVIIRDDANAAVNLTARLIAEAMHKKPGTVLGLATGRTMEAVYAEMARLHRDENLDFSLAKTFNLDEYIGLPPENKNSYRYYMNYHLFKNVNIDLRNTHLPNGIADNIDLECENYEKLIAECGGIDLQLLGMDATAISDSMNRCPHCGRAPVPNHLLR